MPETDAAETTRGDEERAHSLTVRLPLRLYREATGLARRRGLSLNRLVQEGLEAVIRAEAYTRLYDAFTVVSAEDGGTARGGSTASERTPGGY